MFAYRVTVEYSAVIEGNLFHHELTMAAGIQMEGRTPWRPMNWFEDIPDELFMDETQTDETQGDTDEHVRTQ